MLIATQTGRAEWLRDRTRLYHVVRFIGRWSMIDIFMESLLGALVRFGSVITIEPGIGALAFCGVVILTMFAAETLRSAADVGRGGTTDPELRRPRVIAAAAPTCGRLPLWHAVSRRHRHRRNAPWPRPAGDQRRIHGDLQLRLSLPMHLHQPAGAGDA